ncbi:MAG: hypothetical protein IKZ44_00375 [Clostridia bacterium]|nr:hypothetical protein [Clostridia bacterium]
MKRIISILLIALLFLACQPTPESSIIVGKDQTAMIEQAKKPIAAELQNLTIRERLDAPDRLTYSYHKGNLTIDADAEVVVPDAELPIVRVFPMEFDQETVTELWNVLVGDVPMTARVNVPAKEEIASRIQTLTAAIDNGDLATYHFASQEEAEQAIAVLKRQYREAPDVASGDPADGTLLKGVYLDDTGKEVSTNTYLNAESYETGYRFSVTNSGTNREPVIKKFYDEYGREIGTSTLPVSSGGAFSFVKGNEAEIRCYIYERELTFSDGCPKEGGDTLTVTPAQARASAEDCLRRSGLDGSYRVQRIFLIRDYGSTRFSYRIVCTHTVNGCETLMAGNVIDVDEDDIYAPQWQLEKLLLDVNDSGIYYVRFDHPLAISDVITEQTNLLPFSEIKAIMKKMLPIIYRNDHPDENSDIVTEMHINRVELGLWRVRIQDKIDQGMLIPVWAFYAYTKEHDPSGMFDDTVNYMPILILNAVDGSVINPQKGY